MKEFPSVLLKLEEIKQLELTFINEIDIPDELSKVKIERLKLSGELLKKRCNASKLYFPIPTLR